ncbi:MAG: hypothetical protein KDC40_12520 [Actinobacteria bacterium]|nr:hypothetical protein [Actinomycetota bacterium]HRY08339.1 hypothetical protein [Candidatus Nanopelagicales bacterium]
MSHTTPITEDLAAEISDGMRQVRDDLAEARGRGLDAPTLTGTITAFELLAAAEWLQERDLLGCSR